MLFPLNANWLEQQMCQPLCTAVLYEVGVKSYLCGVGLTLGTVDDGLKKKGALKAEKQV